MYYDVFLSSLFIVILFNKSFKWLCWSERMDNESDRDITESDRDLSES